MKVRKKIQIFWIIFNVLNFYWRKSVQGLLIISVWYGWEISQNSRTGRKVILVIRFIFC